MQTELIHKFLNGYTSDEEVQALLNWVEASPENARIFAEVKNKWAARDFQNHAFKLNLQQEFELTWNQLPQTANESKSLLRLMRPLMKYAAIIIVTFFSSYLVFEYALSKKSGPPNITYHELFSGKGQKSQLVLLDGTKVWLNSDSRLKYGNDYNQAERIVYLEGEAFFEVAKDAVKPFLVKTSNITVKALGTSFNVKAFHGDDTFETSLLSGSVSIQNEYLQGTKEGNLVLTPNQQYRFSTRPVPSVIIVEDKDLSQSKAWTDNVLVFRSESLGDISMKLERWFDVKVHIMDQSITKNVYSGTFKNKETLKQVLTVLKQTTPIDFSIKENNIYIFKK